MLRSRIMGVLTKWAEQGVLMLNTVLDGAGASGKFSQRNRMGGIYGCSDYGIEQPGPTDCIHSLGSACTAEKSDAS